MIWVIIGMSVCAGGVVGMILGKLFTEREMTDHGDALYNVGYEQGYHDGYEQAKQFRRP